jgi:hypothetical protein
MTWSYGLGSGQRLAGDRWAAGSKAFDQIDDLEALVRFQPEECLQKPKAFDRVARWSSEPVVQLRHKCGIAHLAPLTGNVNGISQQT